MSKDSKCIFITGAASGIGRETAILFAQKGWFIGGYDVNEEGLKSLKDELGPDRCLVEKLDVTDRAAYAAVLDRFGQATGGKLDLMFNNAGIGVFGHFADMTLEDMDRVVDINFKGVINGIHFALPLLKKTPGSLCFTTSSSSGIFGAAGLAMYSATKHAVKGLTEALSVEFAAFGVRAADTLPGVIETPIWVSKDMLRGMPKQGPWRVVPPRAVAEAVWAAYHGDSVHWYVPEELEELEVKVAADPTRIRNGHLTGKPWQ